MYIITRYVVWEVLKLFLAALVGLTLVVTFGMCLKEGFSRGLPGMVMLRTMPFMLPEMLGITIPVSMLFSVASVFGRMTGTNEVVALKSLGISPMAVVWPAVVLAGFLSLGTVWMYETAATWCRPNVQRIISESLEDIAYGMLQKNRSFDCEQFSIAVKRVSGRKLIKPIIIIRGQPGRPKITLTASEAELRTDKKAKVLRIICRRTEVDIEGQDGLGQLGMTSPGVEEYPIPIEIPGPPPYHRDWVAMNQIPGLIAELQTTVRRLELLRDAQAPLGIPESPEDAKKIADYRRLIYRLKTESYRRWANGFTCLCFTLIGAPVAMLWRHADVLTNFFVCFLPILAVYYPLLMIGEDLATSGRLPPIFFWSSNVVLVIPAILLLRRIIRH